MTIETKYNIGDEVWFMKNNKPARGTVIKIDIDKHIELKMKYNANRPNKHGKLF